MKDINKQMEFIELRSKNLSLQKISDRIGVSKPTLIKWNRNFRYEVDNLHNAELESLCEEYKLSMEQRIKYLGDLQEKVLSELEKRSLKNVKTEKLFEMLIKTSDKLQDAKGNFRPSFLTPEEINGYKEEDKMLESLKIV